jgi:hypothetical protein
MISALLTRREHVIAPILAAVRGPKLGRKPKAWTPVDRDYEALRIDMQTPSHTSASTASTPPLHRQHFVDRIPASA